MNSAYLLGLDIGSVSVKLALISKAGKILETHYRRSRGEPLRTTLNLLRELLTRRDLVSAAQQGQVISWGVTGSGGRLISELLRGKFINEIIAQTRSIALFYPRVRTVIEMGGEDSKLMLFDRDEKGRTVLKDFSLNMVCAAGTGSFLDQQASRLGFSIEDEFGKIASQSESPSRIAGRCSVFAKSDMIHLQQIGTPVRDIVAGLCYAVARSFIGGVGKGKNFLKPIIFQGGVAANIGLIRAFEDLLGIKPGELVIPKYYAVMGAIGAAFIALEDQKICFSENLQKAIENLEKYLSLPQSNKEAGDKLGPINRARTSESKAAASFMRLDEQRLKSLNIELEKREYDLVESSKLPITNELSEFQRQDAFLGIDVGSLSTNLVVINPQKSVLSRRYLRTAGRPIEIVIQGLKEVGEEISSRVNIRGVGITGSGRYMIADLVGADLVKNEITAQATAGIHFIPEVDTIFEIGGQDSKYIKIQQKAVVDFEMNKVCAAGTGSFLEEQAEKLGISIEDDFARLAFSASSPSRLGDRCTVFMDSDLVSHQQKGAKKEDLVAGLSYSIVYNYLNRVVGNHSVGKQILFQGGVAYNQAVVEAFEKILNKKIIVPPHHDITGAIGAALLVMNKQTYRSRSRFKGFNLTKISYQVRTFECKSCENLCNVSRVKFGADPPHFYGARCEIFEGDKKKKSEQLPDLFALRKKLLLKGLNNYSPYPSEKGIKKEKNSPRKKIGIPLVLHFYELFPYWRTFFEELGFKIVVSEQTTPRIIQEAIPAVKAETCFPLKIVHGHILNLLKKEIDYLFLPSIINMEKRGCGYEQNYNCPLAQSLPYIIKSALDWGENSCQILNPPLHFQYGEKSVIQRLIKLGRKLGKNRGEIKRAAKTARKAQSQFIEELKNKGAEVLRDLDPKKINVVFVGHSYNTCDPGVNFNLASRLKEMGAQAIPFDFLPLWKVDLSGKYPNMYWRSGQKMLSAVEIIKNDPRLQAIHLSNFHCGPDSFISYFLSEHMENKPYLQLELDEHSADAGVVTRCEAFFDSLKNNKTRINRRERNAAVSCLSHKDKKSLRQAIIYLPYMCDHSRAIGASFRACGIKAEVLPESDTRSLELGRRYVSGKECLPFTITLGDFLKKIAEPNFNPANSAFFMPQTSGPCRFGQYNRLHQVILKELGYGDVAIISPGTQDAYTDFGEVKRNFRRICWQGIVAIDLLEKLARKYRPYELNQGETDLLYQESLNLIIQTMEQDYLQLGAIMEKIKKGFLSLRIDDSEQKPIIGVVGEIFIRANRFSNSQLVRKIEEFGAETRVAPMSEWISYTTYCYKNTSLDTKDYLSYFKGIIQDKIQNKDEDHLLKSCQSGNSLNCAEPAIEEILKNSNKYIHKSLEGEAILSIGKAIDYLKKGAKGIINVMPFTCMPGMIVTAISKRFREDHQNIPWLNMVYDGQENNNFETRLEAFIHQTKEVNKKWL